MSRHSALCRDSGARHGVATKLCVRDIDTLSRQCSVVLHRDRPSQARTRATDQVELARQRYSVATDFLQWCKKKKRTPWDWGVTINVILKIKRNPQKKSKLVNLMSFFFFFF